MRAGCNGAFLLADSACYLLAATKQQGAPQPISIEQRASLVQDISQERGRCFRLLQPPLRHGLVMVLCDRLAVL